MRLLSSILLVLAGFFASAEDACFDASNFCTGLSVTKTDGSCSSLFRMCEDNDPLTNSTCSATDFLCSHINIDGLCTKHCEPDCTNKTCGEDSCGGFCGICPDGFGCANYECVQGMAEGTCDMPKNLGDGSTETVINVADRVTIVTYGDTSQSIHYHTPTCNTLTASPELIYKFVIPAGQTYGYDIRAWEYDTVLVLTKDKCGSLGNVGTEFQTDNLTSEGNSSHVIDCNDDATPPGDFGSRISGSIGEGTYYIMVDGYSTTDNGPFTLVTTFVRDCVPLCDGNFCGDDMCGGSCGTCGDSFACNPNDKKCYPENCQPSCELFGRSCGEDGCGGSCGTCSDGLFCLGEAIETEEDDGTIPSSSCEAFPVCNHNAPVCIGCTASQICASDCQCYDSLQDLPDLVVIDSGMTDETYLHDVNVPETSCTLIEGCVKKAGWRRLLRFTSTVLNQGQADLSFPEPKDRPDLFEYGHCHQHYHFKSFAQYTLFDANGKNVVMQGAKYAYCMEDTARHFDGANISCDRKYDCGYQGIQRGWVDQYGWSLDCSWLDITDLEAGTYVLEIETNPSKVFPEVSYDNNKGSVRVEIPNVAAQSLTTPLKLDAVRFVAPSPTASPTTSATKIVSSTAAFFSVLAFALTM